jgi:DNA-directed RNA polymerase subunit omega
MARVTIEDSLKNADNVFELIRLAAMRAYQLQCGAQPHINPGNSKATVVALREIAAGYVDIDPRTSEHTGERDDNVE